MDYLRETDTDQQLTMALVGAAGMKIRKNDIHDDLSRRIRHEIAEML